MKVGTAQGCPLSPLLFLVIIEGFIRLIKGDSTLEGIKVGNVHHKIGHFADDTIAALRDETHIARFNTNNSIFCSATHMAENN